MVIHNDYPCHTSNYRKGRSNVTEYYLGVHYVGATGDAKANAKYYSTTPNIGASAHFFVGHGPSPEVWSSVPEGSTAYHVGANKYVHPACRNNNSIGVELCCHKTASGEWYFDSATVDAAVELCRDIVARYNIPPERVLRHYDVTGKNCPAPYVEAPLAWELFKSRIFKEEKGMNKCTVKIKLADIERVAVVFGNGRSLAQVKVAAGCDYIINGGLYEGTGPVCHLKVDGVVKAKDQWGYIGYGWDHGPDIRELAVPEEGGQARNYIACVQLLGRGMAVGDKPIYGKELGGKRGRTAMALTQDSLILYATRDSSSYAATPEALQAEMAQMGVTSALMLDSGGSSQCDFGGGQTVTSSRKVNNYICVWLKKTPIGRYKVATNGGTLTIRDGIGTDNAILGSYPNGSVVDVYEIKSGWARTDKGWCSMGYLTPVVEAPATPAQPETPATSTADQPDEWAKADWEWAKDKGLLDGTRPRDPITRQELAVALHRLKEVE